eukprot:CAMPEP_0184334364 /NCGR_PEP_ID=MMETSP1089-20130417/3180_1 /TAXON_ID=38269 ORGANISM="Gloeochaete wittrockiana, Strain SAG46.84" /NCGR_SAMPLE_ID=MMETSP1089 /ASSEMBLY_ACC=CAM_ASM_000445 /LENGTH=75 /DNA_ID=CAMNT_0026658603 /DNA_START=425 /DNA_END=652 /DNA_ORIENTATION=+
MMEVDGWWRKEMRDGECVGETDDGEQRETEEEGTANHKKKRWGWSGFRKPMTKDKACEMTMINDNRERDEESEGK